MWSSARKGRTGTNKRKIGESPPFRAFSFFAMHIGLARWRLRAGSPRGQKASSPSASSRLQLCFALRAYACGFGIDQVDCFFRLRGWRTRGPSGRALLSITRPQRRGRSASPSFGNHKPPLPPRGQPHVSLGSSVQWGLSVWHSWITGASPSQSSGSYHDTLNAKNAAERVRPLLNEGAAGMCSIQV